MKKAISLFLVFGMVFLPCATVFAQKSRLLGSEKVRKEPERVVRPEAKVSTAFGDVQAITTGSQVLIRWQMQVETANLGFYVHRINGKGETTLNDQIVFGSAATAAKQPLYGEQYSYLDVYGNLGSTYYFEAVDMDGNRIQSPIVSTKLSKFNLANTHTTPSNEPGRTEGSSFSTENLSLTKELVSKIETVSTAPDPDKHKWVMAHQGARIDVKSEGIFRVSFSQLQSAGFDVNADKSLWQLYKNGVEQAISINEVGGYIEFYGYGIDTPETDIQGYFLIVGDTPGKRMLNSVARPSTSTLVQANYNQTSTYKERLNYLNTILNGPAENYFGNSITGSGRNFNFDLTGIDTSISTATLEIKAQGFSGGNHSIRVILNGQQLDPVTGVAQFPLSGTQTIPTSLLLDKAVCNCSNVLNLASTAPGAPTDINLFDQVNVKFARKHLAAQNVLKAYTISNKRAQLSGFTSANVRVFDITFENDVQAITNLPFEQQGSSFGAVLPSGRPRVIFAVDDSAVKVPFAVVPNDGEVLASPTQGANLIIIAYKDFMTQAQAWANYRTSQGFSVKVVNVDEVYNEFNYGSLSSDSIKSFLDYAYHSWSTPPQYVLLIGDGSVDSRNYQGVGFYNYIPPRIVTTVFTETGSDDSTVDFDNDGLAELAIGRIPARLPSEVDTALQKTINWETNLLSDPLSRGALFAVDVFYSTNNIHFPAISDRIKGELPASMPTTTNLRSEANSQTSLINAMNTGVANTGNLVVNYTGHGSAGTWNNTGYFWTDNATALTNHNKESIYTMLTCLNGYYLSLGLISLGEALLNNTNGGAVAAWASTGLTTPDVQEIMAKRFYRKLGEGTIPRMGDLVKDAKTVIIGGTDVRLSWTLLGDPMLKVR
jgi:hypothetical protein